MSRSLEHVVHEHLRAIVARLPGLAGPAARVRVVADAVASGAAVSADARVLLNPAWFLERSPEDRQFILAHELMHLLLESHTRGRGLDPLLWNLAHDLAINARLARALDHLPADALFAATVASWSGERIYWACVDHRAPDDVRRAMRGFGEARPWHDTAGESARDGDDRSGERRGAGGLAGKGGLAGRYRRVPWDADEVTEAVSLVLDVKRRAPRWLGAWSIAWDRAGTAARQRSWRRASRRHRYADGLVAPGRAATPPEVEIWLDTSPSMHVHIARALGEIAAWLEDHGVAEFRLVQWDGGGVVAVDPRLATLAPCMVITGPLRAVVLPGRRGHHGLTVCQGCGLPHAALRPDPNGPLTSAHMHARAVGARTLRLGLTDARVDRSIDIAVVSGA